MPFLLCTILMARLMKSMEKVLKQNNTMDIEEVMVGRVPWPRCTSPTLTRWARCRAWG